MNGRFKTVYGRRAIGALLLALAACGQSPEPQPGTQTTAEPLGKPGARQAAKALQATTPQQGGAWSTPFDMNVIAIHMALQPNGSVLYYGSNRDGGQDGTREYGFWEPSSKDELGSVTMLPNVNGTNTFCSAQILLQDGSTLIAGGQRTGPGQGLGTAESNVVDGASRAISKRSALLRPRWYASATTLMNGETYLQGGAEGNDLPEIRGNDGVHRLLSGANTSALWYAYPRNYIAPDGRIFGVDGTAKMYFVDPGGNGSLVRAGELPNTVWGEKSAMAQFRPGRFLKLGEQTPEAVVIDIRAGSPSFKKTEALASARADGVATVLPDGRVLMTGGSGQHNILERAVKSAEVWNPVTGEWTVGPAQRNARLYHGSALLLQDGRVLVAGGGAYGPLSNRNGEIYSPSYLFDASGRRATQTTLAAAPTVLAPGRSFELQVASGSVSRVTLVRFGTMSHSWSGDQTFVDLPFRPKAAGGAAVVAQLPARATHTPPGFYLLFAFDERGVPSIGRTLRILPPGSVATGDDVSSQVPMISQIADRAWSGGPATIQPWGYSPRGLPLSWSASGLPPGLAIDASNGAIAGTPSAPGEYHVTVAADDGTYVGSTSFIWSVSPPELRLEPLVSPGPVAAGASVRFQAQASGQGLTYEWNFGDGSATTERRSSPSVDHVFRSAGVFNVTVTAYDRLGRPVTATFRQTVTAVSALRPAARSSMIAWTGAGAGARIWVANPDSDTVTGFDAASGARVAEIAVPRQPVTLSAAGDGRLWVASRRGDALTVIDPTSASIVRTIPMEAGSLPYGIVGDPAGKAIWVVLEGRGRLIRHDAATGQQNGSVDLGPDIRHVSVTGDSSTVLVSRFVTPPLPGESTAAVKVAGRGGEVLRVDAVSLARLGSVVLGHSDRPDFENSGRGIPNYLGAVAISPDGRQAFVPSKQDNVMRGRLRDGRDLDFQNTVRAVSSRIDLRTMTEDPAQRVDHDNASVASAAAFDPSGTLLFVALETSREIAVVDASTRAQLMRIDTGRAPQGLLVSPDGARLYVANFMDRSVGVYDLQPLLARGRTELPLIATLQSTGAEKLSAQVLAGKKLFYDARDPRLARDGYMSCATCHADGGHDGRTWDLTGFGEGLRNTISLRGRGGMRAGPLHWSGNFDEVQDFEGQIRQLAGGSGLLSNDLFKAGTRGQPLGAPKAGLSADLDALAAYVGSLVEADPVPRSSWMSNPTEFARALMGRAVFTDRCATCHVGTIGTDSAPGGGHDVGTIAASSGKRLDGRLTGLDTPPLTDAWQTAPYLHDGSAPTIEAAVQRHVPDLSADDLRAVAAFVRAGAVDPERSARRMEGAEVTVAGVARVLPHAQVQLTDGPSQQAGLWSAQPWLTSRPFTTSFDFTIDGNRPHADGIAFVLHGGPTNAIGLGGGCLGACGLPSWLAASLHTWSNNSGGWEGEGLGRPQRPLGFEAGNAQRIVGRMSIAWNPRQNRLSMAVSMLVDGTPRQFTDSMTLDLRARFGERVTVGITAATGAGHALQRVSGWSATAGVVAPRREGLREDFGGWAASAPECVSWSEQRIDCMVVGGDGALYQRWSDDAGQRWDGWYRLGGALATERPSCVSVGENLLDCFAVGVDRALWQLRFDGASWLPWRSLGGWLSAAPSCVAASGGRIDCFARGGGEGALWINSAAGAGVVNWTGWRSLGGVLDSAPVCTTDLSGAAQCFARGPDGAMRQSSANGQWRSHGGWIKGEPSCATRADGLTSCFVRGGDDGLWRTDFDGVNWRGWRAEPGTAGRMGAPPRCVANRGRDGIDCAIVSPDGVLRLFSRDEGGPLDGSWPMRTLATGRLVEAPGCVARRGAVDCASRESATRAVQATGATVD
jgi:DNA-binding beta-propeller fold protein YncE